MKQLIVLLMIVCAVTWPVRGDILYSQSPPLGSPTIAGAYSNSDARMSADNFTLSEDATITGLRWYGMYESGSTSTSQEFGVSFFSDTGGLPGGEIGQFPVTATASDTGLGLSWKPIYEYTTHDFSPVTVAAGETIWLSIYEADGDTTVRWLWNLYSYGGSFAQIDTSLPDPDWARVGGDLAFALEDRVVPVPGAVLLGVLGLSFAGWRLRQKTT